MDKKTEAVQSIVRASKILQSIGRGSHSITEIAGECQLSNSTVHRLLQAMVGSHLVIQDSIGHKYFIGDLITHLVSKPEVSHEYLINFARDEMEKLSEATGETVILMIMTGHNFQILHEVPSKHYLRIVGAGAISLHPALTRGAAGKVLWSMLDNKSLETALKYINHTNSDQISLPEKQKLKRQVKLTGKKGYAISSDNIIAGAMCMAVPIKNYVMPTALCIIGPKTRLKPLSKKSLAQLIDSAVIISSRIENKMGLFSL
ncbi:MAG: helix-turn-helix domain-containing protein [Dehalococcoidales bacterium]|nr:helix-turn-helix domain-containing protein [Dehalococcoidales bacterium]